MALPCKSCSSDVLELVCDAAGAWWVGCTFCGRLQPDAAIPVRYSRAFRCYRAFTAVGGPSGWFTSLEHMQATETQPFTRRVLPTEYGRGET